jgi:hypothetical protein
MLSHDDSDDETRPLFNNNRSIQQTPTNQQQFNTYTNTNYKWKIKPENGIICLIFGLGIALVQTNKYIQNMNKC